MLKPRPIIYITLRDRKAKTAAGFSVYGLPLSRVLADLRAVYEKPQDKPSRRNSKS